MVSCAFCQKCGECTQDYFENIPICDECAKEVATGLIRDGKEFLVGPELLKEKVMTKKMHWAGGLRLEKARMSPGWPCCCSGASAEKVAREGNQTRNILEVTCKRCLASLEKAGIVEKVEYEQ